MSQKTQGTRTDEEKPPGDHGSNTVRRPLCELSREARLIKVEYENKNDGRMTKPRVYGGGLKTTIHKAPNSSDDEHDVLTLPQISEILLVVT